MKPTHRSAALCALLAAFALTIAAASPAMAKDANQGYIYGKVTTRTDNVYQGLIRWGTEEAFWDDLFNSNKESLPYSKYLEKESSRSRHELKDVERQLEKVEKHVDQMEQDAEKIADEARRTKDDDRRRSLEKKRQDLERQREDFQRQREELDRERERLDALRGSKRISVLGGALTIDWNDWVTSSRLFITRFGDIRKIEVIGSEDAELTMRSGTVYTVSGYSNDVGGTINVRDKSLGDIELPWRKISTIEFMETPGDVKPAGYRLNGTVSTDGGEYKGYIQWDSEECLSTDQLDGDSEDGRMSIDMGQIRSIARRGRSGSLVELKDGRKLHLEGTNDVNSSIRGIMVEDTRYGRVKIPWDSFDKVVFGDKDGSGRGYDDYGKGHKLHGTVTDFDGKAYKGRLVFDIDESESWEMLNGDLFDVEFDIPFNMVKSITPRSRNASMVELFNGETLRLEGSQDVSSSNDGVLVFDKDEKNPNYVSWDKVEKIEFTK